MTDGRPLPSSNFLTDIVTFSVDGNTFLVNNNEKETVAITMGQNGGIEFCEIGNSTKLAGARINPSPFLCQTNFLFRIEDLGVQSEFIVTAGFNKARHSAG